MRIIANDLAKVLRIFNQDEMRPIQAISQQTLIDAITERYKFSTPPQMPTKEQVGIRFSMGQADINGAKISISALTTYSDGIDISTYSTDQAIFIMDDMIEWLENKFKFRKPTTPPNTFFESHIVVDFDVPMDGLIKAFSRISASYGHAIKNTYNVPLKVDFAAFGMGWEQTSLPNAIAPFFKNKDFIINRRIGSPFSANRYHCQAPLPTDKHISVLQDFENAIIS